MPSIAVGSGCRLPHRKIRQVGDGASVAYIAYFRHDVLSALRICRSGARNPVSQRCDTLAAGEIFDACIVPTLDHPVHPLKKGGEFALRGSASVRPPHVLFRPEEISMIGCAMTWCISHTCIACSFSTGTRSALYRWRRSDRRGP